MKTILRFVAPFAFLALAACSDEASGNGNTDGGPPGGPPCDALPLKTPRAPRILWSCQRQAFLTKLHDTNDPQWQELLATADRSGTSNPSYADLGGYAAIVYQITGDQSYATKARDQMRVELGKNKAFSANYHREFSAEYAQIYDWVQGGLTDSEKQEFTDIFYAWIDGALGGDSLRAGDTDQTVGSYFGAQFLAIATEGDSRVSKITGSAKLGGLDATEASFSNLRNAIKMYMSDFAAGGVWMESSAYNPGTVQLAALGVEGLRNALGTDHFPEFADYSKAAVPAMMHELTSDFLEVGEWGDIDEPHVIALNERMQAIGMFTGLLADSDPIKPLAVSFVKDIAAQAKAMDEKVSRARFYYFFDPTAAGDDYRAKLPTSYYAPGQGMVFARDSWQKDGSQVFMHLPRTEIFCDHENMQFGNFQMYRKGASVLTNPLGYGGGAIAPDDVNSIVIAGLNSMPVRKNLGYTGSSDGSFAYFAGGAQGVTYLPLSDVSNPPPEFVHEWTRSFVYLSTTGRTADTLVVYDRVDADHPTNLNDFPSQDQASIMAAAHLKTSVIHALTSPSVAGNHATWTASSQQVELTILAPASVTTSTVDEHALSAWPSGAPPDSERHFYIAISPTADQKFDTFLNVVQVSDAAVAQKPLRIASGDGMEGALVARPGQRDAVVLFSAAQGTRVRSTSFSFTVTPGSSGVDLYVADLDVSKGWSSSAGGDLTVDPGGLSRVSISNGGMQTITISPK